MKSQSKDSKRWRIHGMAVGDLLWKPVAETIGVARLPRPAAEVESALCQISPMWEGDGGCAQARLASACHSWSQRIAGFAQGLWEDLALGHKSSVPKQHRRKGLWHVD